MLIRTHLTITLFFVLLLINSVESKLVFALVALIATFIPDIDTRFSTLGMKKTFRFLQFFTKHRGMVHSFTFLISITLFFVLFFPVLALGFFLGYGLHLLADSFTLDGIAPFYPHKRKSTGSVKTGGRIESLILASFIVGDLGLVFLKILV